MEGTKLGPRDLVVDELHTASAYTAITVRQEKGDKYMLQTAVRITEGSIWDR